MAADTNLHFRAAVGWSDPYFAIFLRRYNTNTSDISMRFSGCGCYVYHRLNWVYGSIYEQRAYSVCRLNTWNDEQSKHTLASFLSRATSLSIFFNSSLSSCSSISSPCDNGHGVTFY